MAEFLKTISRWEGAKGRGLGGQADVVGSPQSFGSDEVRSLSLGCVGIGRGIQSNSNDVGQQEISSPYPGTVRDVDLRCPPKSVQSIESLRERVDEQGGETLLGKGQPVDSTFPELSNTSISASAADLKPVEHVMGKNTYLPPVPPEDDQSLGSPKVGSSVTTPSAANHDVLVISEFINPLVSSSLGFDGGQEDVDSAAASHVATVTAAFLPGVHHPQREPKKHREPELSVEPTLANILHHTFQLLSQRPGTFIGVMPALVSILKVNLREEDDMEEIIDSLCYASIQDENFRYNGARVCTHLADELRSFRFMEHLLDRCRKEFDLGLDSVWLAGDWRLCGKVALFIGELMIQLQADVGQPTEILVRFVISLLDRLLCFDDEALLKCLVQLLKLTGARLNVIVQDDLCRIMDEIRHSVLLRASSRKSRELLLSIVELDARGWMKDEELSGDGDTAAGGDGSSRMISSLLQQEEGKVVVESCSYQKVMENAFYVPQESAPGATNGNNELDDLVEDLTEEERSGLEIAHCYEQYLRETGEEEL